jgi:hypothetical protein
MNYSLEMDTFYIHARRLPIIALQSITLFGLTFLDRLERHLTKTFSFWVIHKNCNTSSTTQHCEEPGSGPLDINMGSSEIADQNYPAEIIGYVEPWICSPGETVDVKVRLFNT